MSEQQNLPIEQQIALRPHLEQALKKLKRELRENASANLERQYKRLQGIIRGLDIQHCPVDLVKDIQQCLTKAFSQKSEGK